VGVSRGFALDRGRAELGLGDRGAQVRVAGLAARSGGSAGYVGVDGEAFVPVVQIAEARYDAPRVGLAAAGGLIDDPWVATVEPGWALPELAPTLTLDQGYLDRADLGAFVGFSAPDGVAGATVAVTSGEGYERRERNDDVDATLVARAQLASGPATTRIAAFGRLGSRGLGAERDDRLGASVSVAADPVVAGAEAVLGWGLQGDGARRPLGLSAWARTGDAAPVLAVGRAGVARDDWGSADAEESLVLAALGVRLPLDRGPLAVLAGYQHRSYQPDAEGVAGASALDRSDQVFVEITARLTAARPVQ
jgi:hypothetical protein